MMKRVVARIQRASAKKYGSVNSRIMALLRSILLLRPHYTIGLGQIEPTMRPNTAIDDSIVLFLSILSGSQSFSWTASTYPTPALASMKPPLKQPMAKLVVSQKK